MIEVGGQGPEFTLPSTGGSEVSLHATAATKRATILLFYVLDFTPG